MNLTLTKVHKTKKPNKLYYTGDNHDIYFLQSDSVIHFFYNLKGYIGRNIYNILLAKRMKKKNNNKSPIYTPGGSWVTFFRTQLLCLYFGEKQI